MEFTKIVTDGYNPEEVDAYIAKVSQNYKQLHEAYKDQRSKIEQLMQAVQIIKNENVQLADENSRLKQDIAAAPAAPAPAPVAVPASDLNMMAKLMLDAEMFAKHIKEKSQAEAEQILADTETKVRMLELKRESMLIAIRQLAEELTALAGGKQDDKIAGGNKSGVPDGTGVQNADGGVYSGFRAIPIEQGIAERKPV